MTAKDTLERRKKYLKSYKMETMNLQILVRNAFRKRLLAGINSQKREVVLKMDQDLFDEIAEALKD